MNKTKFLRDENGNLIGRVDENGVLYTLSLSPSQSHYHTPQGLAVNKSHAAREAAAANVTFED